MAGARGSRRLQSIVGTLPPHVECGARERENGALPGRAPHPLLLGGAYLSAICAVIVPT
jgi:hypothetical protein